MRARVCGIKYSKVISRDALGNKGRFHRKEERRKYFPEESMKLDVFLNSSLMLL